VCFHHHLRRCCCFFSLDLYLCFLICIYALVLLYLGIVYEESCCHILVFASLTNPTWKSSVPSFHRHPFGCLVRCLLMGYLWVSMGFEYLTTFSGTFREARVIFDPLPTICVSFLHCNFCFGCFVREAHLLFGVLILVPFPLFA
jgi:hypothetical protein